jgi:hypothetical protein
VRHLPITDYRRWVQSVPPGRPCPMTQRGDIPRGTRAPREGRTLWSRRSTAAAANMSSAVPSTTPPARSAHLRVARAASPDRRYRPADGRQSWLPSRCRPPLSPPSSSACRTNRTSPRTLCVEHAGDYSSRANRQALRDKRVHATIPEPDDQIANRKRRGSRGAGSRTGSPPSRTWRDMTRRRPRPAARPNRRRPSHVEFEIRGLSPVPAERSSMRPHLHSRFHSERSTR